MEMKVGWVISEIYFGFSVYAFYLWGKRVIRKPMVHVALCS